MLLDYLKRTEEFSNEKYYKVGLVILLTGMLSFITSSILSRFFSGINGLDFIQGFLTVISIFLNTIGVTIVLKSKKGV